MSKWKCDSCGTIHRRNPSKCRSCGNTVLSPYHGDDDGGLLDDRRVRYGLIALVILVVLVLAFVVL